MTDPLVMRGMLALRPANVAVLGGRAPRLAAARARALAVWAEPPSGAGPGDGPDLYGRARAAAWAGDERAGAAPVAAAAAAPRAPARAPPPPPPAAPPPRAPPAPKPDPDVILVDSDDGSDAENEAPSAGVVGAGPSAPAPPSCLFGPTPPPWPRAADIAAAAAAPAGARSLARGRVAGATTALRFLDAAGDALPAYALDVTLADENGSVPASVSGAALEAAVGALPAVLAARYASPGGRDALLATMASLKATLAAADGWLGVEGGGGGEGAALVAWWPA